MVYDDLPSTNYSKSEGSVRSQDLRTTAKASAEQNLSGGSTSPKKVSFKVRPGLPTARRMAAVSSSVEEDSLVATEAVSTSAAWAHHADDISLFEALPEGYHPTRRCLLHGEPYLSGGSASPKKVSFKVSKDGNAYLCIAHAKHGFLDAARICELAALAHAGASVIILGVPHLTAGLRRLHVVDFAVAATAGAAADTGSSEAAYTLALDTVRNSALLRQRRADQGLRARRTINQNRCRVFAEFVVRNFGIERPRGGVLDVAGGCGGTGVEYAIRWGLECTVVDPTEVRANATLRRLLWKKLKWMRRHPMSPAVRGVAADEEVHRGFAALPAEERGELPPSLRAFLALAGFGSCPMPRQLRVLFDRTSFMERFSRLWQCAAVVVGLHPDEATDSIVEAALAARKPFAVVPCCTFWKENGHRRLSNGSPVFTYAQYVQYLTEKDEAIRVERLHEVPGRNLVLYWSPPEGSLGQCEPCVS